MTEVQRILRRDPVWCAYALCDLDPRSAPFCEWRAEGDALILLYREFGTPILFATPGAEELIARVGEEVSLQIPQSLEEAVRARFRKVTTKRVIRMWLPGEIDGDACEALGDGTEVARLYESGEAPDFFHARMVDDGAFRGLRDGAGRLIAAAGTHTVSERESVATIGNVFVHPAHRGRGLGGRVVAATASALRSRGIATIVLNVREENVAAVRLYRRLGFEEHSVFLEGMVS